MIPKRYLAVPAALVCVLALCLLVNLPASVTTAAAERQLPIYCVEHDTKVCSLSFDAAWGNEDTQALIDILDRYGVKATFFVVGQWVDKYPESVKALSNAGHEVMCHSDDHAHFNTLSAQEIAADVNACCDKIEDVTGRRPTLFRPPFGEYDDHVVATLRGMGMEVIQWDVEASAAGARESLSQSITWGGKGGEQKTRCCFPNLQTQNDKEAEAHPELQGAPSSDSLRLFA